MTEIVNLTSQEKNQLNLFLENNQYPDAYRYLRDVVSSKGGDERVIVWLDRASQINEDVPGNWWSNTVRLTTMRAALAEGKTITNEQFQAVSDNLARSFIQNAINNDGVKNNISAILAEDMLNAVKNLGITTDRFAGTMGALFPTWFFGLDVDGARSEYNNRLPNSFYSKLYNDWESRGIDTSFEVTLTYIGSALEIGFDSGSAVSQSIQEDPIYFFNKISDFIYKNISEGKDAAENTLKNFKLYIKHEIEDLLHDAHTISSDLQSAYAQFLTSVNTVLRANKDPLIIDGGNDGLELNSWQDSGVLFDLDGDGISESAGWVKSAANGGDELFLALDKNQNGNIDSIEELFGNDTTGGFAELSAYDSNHDNIINASDNQFNLLKIWQDTNANGVVDAGEVNTLAAHNITSISLNKINNLTTINGNNVTAVADVNFSDGSVKKIYEVWFGNNGFNTAIANPDVALGQDFEFDLDVLTQPFSRGYGELSSWQVAMSNDVDLLNLAKQISALTPDQFNQIDDLFNQFLFKWAGVENATNATVYNGAETGFDARRMAFLEKATGLDFNYTTQNAIPFAVSAWNLFYNTLLNKFLVQGTFKEIFPDAAYDFATDTLNLNITLDEAITNILSLENELDESSFLNYAYYAQNILKLNRDQFNDAQFDSKVSTAITSIINSASVAGFSFNGFIAAAKPQKQSSGLFLAINENSATPNLGRESSSNQNEVLMQKSDEVLLVINKYLNNEIFGYQNPMNS